MAYTGPSVSIHIKITINPSDTGAFLQALKPTYEHVIAEPLNTFFEVYQDARTPGVFKLVENWNATMDYLRNFQETKEYYKPYFAATKSMYIKPLELEVYSRMPGNQWVSVRQEYYPDRG